MLLQPWIGRIPSQAQNPTKKIFIFFSGSILFSKSKYRYYLTLENSSQQDKYGHV